MANLKKNENKPKAPQNKTKRKASDTVAAQGKKSYPRNSDGKKKTTQKTQSKGKNYTRKPSQNQKGKNRTKKNNIPINISFLGGLNEVGKNMTLYECQGDMILVDCGLAFPDPDMLGVDLVIPDFTYAVQNADKIKGIFITPVSYTHLTLPTKA